MFAVTGTVIGAPWSRLRCCDRRISACQREVCGRGTRGAAFRRDRVSRPVQAGGRAEANARCTSITVSRPTGPSPVSFEYSFLGLSTSTPRDVKEPPSNGQSDSTKQRTPWTGTASPITPFTMSICFSTPSTSFVQSRVRPGGSNSATVGAEIRRDAVLVPDPTNPYDRHAVAVFVDGLHVGYMERPDAKVYHGPIAELPGGELGVPSRTSSTTTR